MYRKLLYFFTATSYPWYQNFSTFVSPFLTLLNTHTGFMNLFISLLLAQLPFIKELSVLSQELLLKISFIFQSASVLECQVRTFHFFFSPFSWQNLKHEGLFAHHIFYLSVWLYSMHPVTNAPVIYSNDSSPEASGTLQFDKLCIKVSLPSPQSPW